MFWLGGRGFERDRRHKVNISVLEGDILGDLMIVVGLMMGFFCDKLLKLRVTQYDNCILSITPYSMFFVRRTIPSPTRRLLAPPGNFSSENSRC